MSWTEKVERKQSENVVFITGDIRRQLNSYADTLTLEGFDVVCKSGEEEENEIREWAGADILCILSRAEDRNYIAKLALAVRSAGGKGRIIGLNLHPLTHEEQTAATNAGVEMLDLQVTLPDELVNHITRSKAPVLSR